MFPDMYLQYNHPTSKSQQKPFDKNRHPHTTNTTSHSIHHSADVNSPHNASSAAPMPHHLPANHKETQPLQPSSAALMAHPIPGNPLNPPALINPHFRQSPHTPTTTSRPEPNSRGDGCHPPSTIRHKKERPAAHPARKERSPNFHQLTIIHNHLRSAYNPIRSHQI